MLEQEKHIYFIDGAKISNAKFVWLAEVVGGSYYFGKIISGSWDESCCKESSCVILFELSLVSPKFNPSILPLLPKNSY